MAREENASYEKSGQRRSLSIDEALKRISELEAQLLSIGNEITKIKQDITNTEGDISSIENSLASKANTNAPTIINPTLRFLLGDESVRAEIRRSGASGEYDLSIVFTNAQGSNSYFSLVNKNGERQYAPNNHASSSSQYGLGTGSNYGHGKGINNLTTSTYRDGEFLAAYQGYVLDNKIGSGQILRMTRISCFSSTFVDDGESWTNVTGTFSAVSGASGYYFIPLSCNFGYVTGVSISGTTVTCTATNASGATHSCGINGLVLAYKNV